jgi:phosphoglycolate phosphatase-like HAD superfamily hydrolase
MRLVLFDIDGTLVHSGGQAKPVFAEAMVEVYGTTGAIDSYDFSGKTDGQIVVELLAAAGVERPAIDAGMPRLHAAYLERLERRFDPALSRVLPGVRALLDHLTSRSDVALGLLTGNFAGGARIKLGLGLASSVWQLRRRRHRPARLPDRARARRTPRRPRLRTTKP